MGLINRAIDIIKIIYEEGEKEWLDEDKYKEKLSELYVELENGELDEAEYEELEEQILGKLRMIREYKKKQGMLED
jgi:predicted lipid-binding transport protein (Tim44 family)